MKKHCVICGAGKMGRAIGFAMKSLGYDISIVETNGPSIDSFYRINGECKTFTHWSQIDQNIDIVISSLPYYATLDAALWAIDNNICYCDLGGSVPVSNSIKEMAERKATKPVMTDLGLAPGWINLMAEELYRLQSDSDTVIMMVGGIPQVYHENDPLNYMVTWSVPGLLNEYSDDCEVLSNGEKRTVEGMSGLENVTINDLNLEAFCTSGASAHSIPSMMERGVKNCIYKTLRWRGHCNFVKYLMNALDKESLETVFNYGSKKHTEDMIVMSTSVSKREQKLSKSMIVLPSKKFSAMQRATAFPIAAVAADLHTTKKPLPGYNDIDLESFKNNLDKLFASD